MAELKVSLVIPAYNEEKYIGECLSYAIKNSHGRFFEIIVIDNASTDKTAEIARAMPGVRVVEEERKGLTFARQRGLDEATGDIIAYIDADTRMPEGWYDMLVKNFSENKKLAGLSGPYFYHDIPRHHQFFVSIYYKIAVPLYWIIGYMATGGNFAIRKDVLHKMGGFDTSISFYGEDTNIARRASKFGKMKFSFNFVMHTSGRRFRGQGLLKTGRVYFANFLSEIFLKKPVTSEYKDIR